MPEFRPVIVIPVYDHDLCIAEITERLARHWPVILVDDGSHAKCAAVLDAVAAKKYPFPVALMRQANGGKGAAVMAGMRRARTDGYTHVLQVDADGQHDLTAAAGFLDAAQKSPRPSSAAIPFMTPQPPWRAKRGGR